VDETLVEPRAGPHDLLIDILGTRFSITAGEDPEYLDEVLAQYQFAVANTQGISGMKDPLRIAILTGFLLCDEINKLQLQVKEDRAHTEAQLAGDEEELQRITEKLITSIDQAIEKTFDD
jgi:cell division protein ZapA (FtsZ GTPase activity inhibitor)